MNLWVETEYKEGKIFEGRTDRGSFTINPAVVSPVEYFACGIIACSGYDIVAMSDKTGKEMMSFRMHADVKRRDTNPMKFEQMHIIYELECDADYETVRKWIKSSIETYCSTINTIRDSVELFFTIRLNGHTEVEKEKIISYGHIDSAEFGANCCGE